MTYSTGSTILAADFNGFLGPTANGGTANANLYDIWGVGSGDRGWGQSTISNPATSSTVTATQWATLVNNLAAAGSQTNTTLTSRSAPTVGNTIAALPAISADLASVTTNRGNASGIGAQYTTGGTTSGPGEGSNPSGWNMTFTSTLTFPSAAQARYFWNAGGLARLDFSFAGGGNDKDPDWAAFAGQVGQIFLSGYIGGANQTIAGGTYSGTTRTNGTGGTQTVLTTNVGWYNLTPGAAATNIFTLYDGTAPYTSDYITVNAQVNSAGTTLTFTTVWHDAGYSQPGENNAISGGAATNLSYYPPSTTYLSNSWGTPTLSATVA